MKIVGIVGRAYFNRDDQKIIQVNENIRKAIARYDDVVCTLLLPTNDIYYPLTKMGEDEIEKKDKLKLDYLLDKCDAFIVPGGSYYYKFDEYIINYAIKNNKPLLSICLGFQDVCSMFSEKRDKFDMTDRLDNDDHYGPSSEYIHDINIKEGTKLYSIIGKNKVSINSVHHDYINFIPHDLVISARSSEDDIIEAIEIDDHKFFIGVQWHPEYLMDDASIKIFDAFIDSIKE